MALGSRFIKCCVGIVVAGGVSSGLALGIPKSNNSDGNLTQQLQVPEVLKLPEVGDKGVVEGNSFSDPVTQNSEEFSAIKEPEESQGPKEEKSKELLQLPEFKQELQTDSPQLPSLDSELSLPENNSLENAGYFIFDLKEDVESLEDYEWEIEHCQKMEKGGEIIFSCPWEYTSEERMIIFHLQVGNKSDIQGHKWSDLSELSLRPLGDDACDLILTFGRNRNLELGLIRKK